MGLDYSWDRSSNSKSRVSKIRLSGGWETQSGEDSQIEIAETNSNTTYLNQTQPKKRNKLIILIGTVSNPNTHSDGQHLLSSQPLPSLLRAFFIYCTSSLHHFTPAPCPLSLLMIHNLSTPPEVSHPQLEPIDWSNASLLPTISSLQIYSSKGFRSGSPSVTVWSCFSRVSAWPSQSI